MKSDVQRRPAQAATPRQAIPEHFAEAEDAGHGGFTIYDFRFSIYASGRWRAQSSKLQGSSKVQTTQAKPCERLGSEPNEQRNDLELDPWSLELLLSFEL